MAKLKILVMNGPNLGHLGERQPDIYGSQGMDHLPVLLEQVLGAGARDLELLYFHSNSEGALIDRLEQARAENLAGVVMNAGALTHTSLALADCLAWIGVPCVEVHLSNVLARIEEPLRQKSYLGQHCLGVIAGFGLMSYALAVQVLAVKAGVKSA